MLKTRAMKLKINFRNVKKDASLCWILMSFTQGSVDCVEMTNDGEHPGKWNDVECETTNNAFLCQLPLGE